LLVSAGGFQCGCSQVETVAASFASPFDSTKFGRPLDPHQSAKPIRLQQSRMKKALSLEDQGLKMVPLVGFELTTYRLQGGCSTN
jgi:hypothetical protein